MINISKVELWAWQAPPKSWVLPLQEGLQDAAAESMLMRGVPPHVSRWPGDVCLRSCGFPDSGMFNADPILLSLPLGIWLSLSSSQLQWRVTLCTTSFMEPDCSSFLGVSSECVPEAAHHSIRIPQLPSWGVSSPGSPRDNWSLLPHSAAGSSTVILQHQPYGLPDVKSAIS